MLSRQQCHVKVAGSRLLDCVKEMYNSKNGAQYQSKGDSKTLLCFPTIKDALSYWLLCDEVQLYNTDYVKGNTSLEKYVGHY